MNLTVAIPQRKKMDNSTVHIEACDFDGKTYMSNIAYRMASDIAFCKKCERDEKFRSKNREREF